MKGSSFHLRWMKEPFIPSHGGYGWRRWVVQVEPVRR
jgi:hypothetical protein